MTIHGVDIASYQPGWTPGSNDDFVFIKASESTNYRNPYRLDQAAAARKKGLQVGWYHFSHPGNVDNQLDYFLATSGIESGDLLACDWEYPGVSNADKDNFIKALKKARPKQRGGLYCNQSWWLNTDTTGYVGDYLWIARYASSAGVTADYKFWQYSDSPIDQDHGYFASLADLKKWAGSATGDDSGGDDGGQATTEAVDPTANAIHTPYGQVGTSWASGYHQGDDWHRGAGSAEIGDPIYAVADGTIIYAADARQTDAGWGSAFGIHVLNQWDDHGRTSIDAHMSKVVVKAGQRVKAGDKIGEKGATGNVSGPHDHHEQHTGTRWSDPDVKPIYPGKTTITPATSDEEDLDMSTQGDAQTRTDNQTVKPDGIYHELRLENGGDVSFNFGGGKHEVNARFILSSLSASEELMVRVFRVDTDADGKQVKDSEVDYWVQGLPGGAGKSYRNFAWKWHVPAPPKGHTRRLRLQAANFTDHDIVVEDIHTIAWKAPL